MISLPFSFEERQEIERLLKQGLSCGEIARRIGRSKNGVVLDVRKCGGKEAYTAKKSIKIFYERNEERKRKISEFNMGRKNHPYQTLKEKIQNLEFQIEILHDTIKGILNDKEN